MTDLHTIVIPDPLRIDLQGQRSNDNWFKLIVVPLVTSIMGLIVGGYITAYTGAKSAHAAKILDTQTAAYVDFANAQARYDWGGAVPATAPAEALDATGARTPAPATTLSPTDVANISIHEASTRIAMFGDVDVVKSVATYIRETEPRKACRDRKDSDLDMYATIRNRFTGETVTATTRADIAMILWGCTWPTTAAGKSS